MATAQGNIKGFFRQKKSAVSKKSSSKPNRNTKLSPVLASLAISPASPPTSDILDINEQTLRQFDMNTAYGPCIGISRIDRWRRARLHGLDPPIEIESLIMLENARQESLWDGCV